MQRIGLLEEALLRIEEEKEQAKWGTDNQGDKEIANAINKEIFGKIRKLPTVLEMILTWHEVNLDLEEGDLIKAALGLSEGRARFYQEDIGSDSANLMQVPTTASQDGTVMETMYCAWAIKFGNIYGVDIYLIPYKFTPVYGFACTVKPVRLSESDRETKTFFSGDISKDFAIETIKEYKKKNQ